LKRLYNTFCHPIECAQCEQTKLSDGYLSDLSDCYDEDLVVPLSVKESNNGSSVSSITSPVNCSEMKESRSRKLLEKTDDIQMCPRMLLSTTRKIAPPLLPLALCLFCSRLFQNDYVDQIMSLIKRRIFVASIFSLMVFLGLKIEWVRKLRRKVPLSVIIAVLLVLYLYRLDRKSPRRYCNNNYARYRQQQNQQRCDRSKRANVILVQRGIRSNGDYLKCCSDMVAEFCHRHFYPF